MEPADGALTSGDVGKGRVPETKEILERFESTTLRNFDLIGVKVLVTAGGTREAIDPVRFIGNNSTGIQGISIAEAANARGAEVTLIIANSDLPTHPNISRIDVTSVQQMADSLATHFPNTDYLFMAAAISDAKPVHQSSTKLKKDEFQRIDLVQNSDLLASISRRKSAQFIVAFAAETDGDVVGNALDKLKSKGADLIYLNNVTGGAIFGAKSTSGLILDASGIIESVTDVSKESLAHTLINNAISKNHKLG